MQNILTFDLFTREDRSDSSHYCLNVIVVSMAVRLISW